jgi:hypothetical protein
MRGDRGDEDDAATSLIQYPAGGELREEMRSFEIDADQLVEALFGGIENVAPLALADAGVVDQ